MSDIKKIVNFIFEAGTARNILRSHHQVLPQSNDSIATHSFRVATIGFILAKIEKVDQAKVIQMCLLHDLAELRTGDANYINKFYRKEDEEKAIKDQWNNLPVEKEAVAILEEYNARKTKEAIVAKEADMLDQIFLQIEYLTPKSGDLKKWHEHIAKDLKTSSGKTLAKAALKTNPLQWLYDLSKTKK
jgi:putative hydrolases of HD superfamily